MPRTMMDRLLVLLFWVVLPLAFWGSILRCALC